VSPAATAVCTPRRLFVAAPATGRSAASSSFATASGSATALQAQIATARAELADCQAALKAAKDELRKAKAAKVELEGAPPVAKASVEEAARRFESAVALRADTLIAHVNRLTLARGLPEAAAAAAVVVGPWSSQPQSTHKAANDGDEPDMIAAALVSANAVDVVFAASTVMGADFAVVARSSAAGGDDARRLVLLVKARPTEDASVRSALAALEYPYHVNRTKKHRNVSEAYRLAATRLNALLARPNVDVVCVAVRYRGAATANAFDSVDIKTVNLDLGSEGKRSKSVVRIVLDGDDVRRLFPDAVASFEDLADLHIGTFDVKMRSNAPERHHGLCGIVVC